MLDAPQVEYSLTGEGWDEDASAISLRGLDAAVYYRSKGVLNCGHANVRALILASLRHWARHYQVDGFCFVNAETLAIGPPSSLLLCMSEPSTEGHWNRRSKLLLTSLRLHAALLLAVTDSVQALSRALIPGSARRAEAADA